MGVEGIDTSVYQGQVDWGAVRASGVAWAYVKATEGHTLTDKQFATSWPGGVQQLAARGVYHFLIPGDGAGQASFFATTVGHLGPGQFWVVDIEPDKQGAPLPSAADLQDFVVEAVARLGPRGLLYGNRDDLTATNAAVTAREHALGGLILADYGVNDGTRHVLNVPAGWPVVAHQYTSAGHVAGISGDVDLDYWLGDAADLQSFAGPSPTDPIITVITQEVDSLPLEIVVQSFSVEGEAVSHMGCNTGGAWLLTASGHVYALGGAPYFDSPAEDKHGEHWVAGGRTAKAFRVRPDGQTGYVVVDAGDESFAYPA